MRLISALDDFSVIFQNSGKWQLFAQKLRPLNKEKRKSVSEEGKYAKQHHYVLAPDRVADLVSGGGLKPDTLKINLKSSLWMSLSESSTTR